MAMQNCNRCNPNVRCRGDHKEKCKGFIPPFDKWKLVEIALAHPTSLNEALSALPFETNIGIHLEGRV